MPASHRTTIACVTGAQRSRSYRSPWLRRDTSTRHKRVTGTGSMASIPCGSRRTTAARSNAKSATHESVASAMSNPMSNPPAEGSGKYPSLVSTPAAVKHPSAA